MRRELAEGRPGTLVDDSIPRTSSGRRKGVRNLSSLGNHRWSSRAHVRDANLMMIEATFLELDASIARDYEHLTAAEAATLAAMSGVKQLVLTHISGRYPDEELLRRCRTACLQWISITS